MKILIVAHRFPPRHRGGAELYALRLAKRLAFEHEIVVFTSDDDLMKRDYHKRVREVEGLRVIEVVNHRRYSEFSESYADPEMEAAFERVLSVERPHLVHFQHLLHHSFNYPAIAAAKGIPNVLTLHEYWLLCARNGQLFDADGERCSGPGLDKCAECMSSFHWGRRGADIWMLRGLANLKRFTGLDLKASARRLRLKKMRRGANASGDQLEAMRKEMLLREASVRDLMEYVDCFIAPSQFLRNRFVDFGLDEDRIVYNDVGTELKDFRDLTRAPIAHGPLRIGFLGSMQPVKGVHVLLEALAALREGSFEAELYGDIEAKPEYVSRMGGKLRTEIRLRGALPAEEVPRFLSSLDVLVVPSIWWENSPLVIHEAFAAGLPVVCSDVGGMAELVRHGVDGLHFRAGDADDLADKLALLADDRGKVQRLRAGVERPRSMKSDAAFHHELFTAVLDHYEQLVAQHGHHGALEDLGHIEDMDGLEGFDLFLEEQNLDRPDQGS